MAFSGCFLLEFVGLLFCYRDWCVDCDFQCGYFEYLTTITERENREKSGDLGVAKRSPVAAAEIILLKM